MTGIPVALRAVIIGGVLAGIMLLPAVLAPGRATQPTIPPRPEATEMDASGLLSSLLLALQILTTAASGVLLARRGSATPLVWTVISAAPLRPPDRRDHTLHRPARH